ncbi:uncharacterized protein LOC123224015 [Mangifera indica]|uniref:uncharacterized protein LOC123224015 n=1 Tax=Mangifera indica TaxID=29780 RepID=UPI001CFC0321|nr:uncharacterized protein LOC123224015 [Mangifera indica]
MANRLKVLLPQFINKAQGAFVGGRSIGENILLCQELMQGYHKDTLEKKCAIKIDIMKAYDSLNWDFLLAALNTIDIPQTFITWIRSCITSPKFSVGLNGELVGFFKSTRGLREASLDDLWYMRNHLTWSNCSEGQRRIACKLDRALVNEYWRDAFVDSFANFLNPSISDHSPCIVTCGGIEERRKVPFKLYNMWAKHESFLSIVREAWKEDFSGSPMFHLVNKLKRLKGELRKVNRDGFWKISDKVLEAKDMVEDIQNRLHNNPFDEDLAKEEKVWLENYSRLSGAEESLACQKTKVHWLKEGDQNTKYFFKCIKAHRNRNYINGVCLEDGTFVSAMGDVKKEFVSYFKKVLNSLDSCNPNIEEIKRLVTFQMKPQDRETMIKDVEEDEIKSIIFAMDNNKATGPDGYGAYFFARTIGL